MSARMRVLILVAFAVGFAIGVLVALLPCDNCNSIVLKLGKHPFLGEHQIYCPLHDR